MGRFFKNHDVMQREDVVRRIAESDPGVARFDRIGEIGVSHRLVDFDKL